MSGHPQPGRVMPPPDGTFGWQDSAACKGSGHLFFGPETETPAAAFARETQAKRICAGCEVRPACLAYAETLPAEIRYHGVYGGLGEQDRESLRRRRSQIARLERERAA